MDFLFCNPFRSLANLLYRMASAGPDVVGVESRPIHLLQGKQVGLGDVNDVDIVAQAGAVRCGVIGPVYLEDWTASRRGLKQEWKYMRFRFVAFSPIQSASAGVEVAERHYAPAVGG